MPAFDAIESSDWAKSVMAKGSLSFSLATAFFARETRLSVRLLYSWCRYCDDQIDRAPSKVEQVRALETLEQQLSALYQGDARDLPREFQALGYLAKRYSIPEQYPRDLIRGMRADVEGKHYQNLDELEDYAYCVAGTVGLMMTHIMGVSSPRAYQHAVDLGIALQFTNIARDLREDFELGRVYLPRQWLAEFGVDEESFGSDRVAVKRAQVARRLVQTAERYYFSGLNGLRYLPWKAALAVRVATLVYRKIGILVARDPAEAWQKRMIVAKADKLVLVGLGLWGALLESAVRLFRPRNKFGIFELEKLS